MTILPICRQSPMTGAKKPIAYIVTIGRSRLPILQTKSLRTRFLYVPITCRANLRANYRTLKCKLLPCYLATHRTRSTHKRLPNMVILSFGGGTNSTALLVEMRERGEPVDLILFADTGGERPETYAYMQTIGEWLESNGMPAITIVRKGGNGETLEENCIRKKMLPSLAYGFKSCSQKYKIAPQDKFCNNHPDVRAAWARGETVTKLIGYDADESHRWYGKSFDTPKYTFRAPLVEWDMGRDECVRSILRAGLPLPGKSSCFFCPASRKPEILDLAAKHPDLMQRALAMEANAELTSVKGLGRRFAWADVIKSAADEVGLFAPAIDCGCYDGSGE